MHPGDKATQRYMRREIGVPRNMVCTLCERNRVPIGRLVLCRVCDDMPLLNSGFLEDGS